MIEQKYISVMKSGPYWIEERGLSNQCRGNSWLEKDLKNGWIVKGLWEDRHWIVFLMERKA